MVVILIYFKKTLNDCNIDMFKRVLCMYFTLNTLYESNHESKWEKVIEIIYTYFLQNHPSLDDFY